MTLDEFVSAGGAPPKRMSLDEFMGESGDILNGDLTQTDVWDEMTPEMQASMTQLQEGWRQTAQPDPEAEQAATDWWEQYVTDPANYGQMKDILDQDEFGNVYAVPEQYKQLTQEGRRAVNARVILANQGAGSLQQGYTKLFEDAKDPDSPDNFLYGKVADQATTRASLQAIGGLGQQIKETYQRYTGDSEGADATNRAGQAMRGSLDELAGGSDMERNARGATESTLKALYAGRAGGLKGIIAWATQGAYNDAKTQAIDSGMDESSAVKYAIGQGALEGGITALFQAMGFGGTEKLLSGNAKWQGVKSLVLGIAGELGEEHSIAITQKTLEKIADIDPTEWTKEQLIQLSLDTTAQTALGYGMAQSVSTATNFASKPWPSRKAAKDAGVDQIVKTAKERHDLAEKVRSGLTAQQFTEQLTAAATTPEEADALLEIYKARAASAGETFDDYVGRRIKGVEKTTKEEAAPLTSGLVRPDGRRGEIEFLAEGQAIIRAFETQSIATLAHETGHLFRRDLLGDDLKVAEQWAGARGGKWNRKSEEKFARGFERYLRDGVAPTKKLASVFTRFKDWLSQVYSKLSASPLNVDISPEMRQVFDRLLTPAPNLTDSNDSYQDLAQPTDSSPNLTEPTPINGQPAPDILSQAPASPDLAAKNASMDEARAAMGLPEISKPAAPGANMPHHVAEAEAIRQRIPERAAGIVMDYLSDKRTEPPTQLEIAGMAVYGDRLNETYARLSEDVNNLTLDEGERRLKAAELERVEQDFDLLSRAMRQVGTAQSLAFSQRKHVVGSDYRPLAVESRAAAVKGDKLTANEKRKITKAVKEHKVAEEKLAEQEKKEAAADETKREKIKTEVKKLKEKIAKAKLPTDLDKYARDLAKQFIAEGVVSRRELIDKVQKAVREVFPETQRRQVIDAISGYGDFTQLSKDEVSVRLRDLKGQLQQISKLKDMSEGKAPAKTGMERREPSDTERALIKEVNEAKKEGGYEVTDPAKQLASALSTIKTRLRNQIKDLQDQINSRQKLIKQKKAPPSDEETKRLIEERDAVKQQFDEMFGKTELTDEQRVAIAERAVKKSIAEYERRLAAGEYPDPPASKTPQTPELIKLRAERDKLRAQYQSGKPVSLDEKKRIETATKAVEKSIADLERRLKEGDFSKTSKRPAPNDKNLQALRERAAALRTKYAETNPNPPALEKAKERLAVLEAHLKAGTLPTVTPRAEAKNPAVKAIQQQLADARKQLSESEPAQKARLRKTIGELQAKLEAGNFSLPEGAARPVSPEVERLQYERDKMRRKIRFEINSLKPQSVWGHISSPFNAARQIITTLDFPPVFRQGAFIALGNPVRAAKATGTAFKAMFSDFNARKSLKEINERPNAPLYARAKLYLADMDGSPSAREEAFVGRLVEKIPGVRSLIHASERNYTVFLNQLRADTFDAMVASLSRNGEPTMKETQAIAKFINVATGRGDFGQFEMAMTGLAPVFFSPRYVASRFQLLAGQPLYGGTAGTRGLIAKEYAKMLVGAGVIYAIALAAGAELEEDPTSADFGKLKFGNSRLDPLGGLSQSTVFLSRMGGGVKETLESWATGEERETSFVKDEGRTAWNFLRSKFSPIASTAINLAVGETAGREAVTPGQVAKDLTIPLSFRDLKNTIEEQGVPAGTAMWLTSLFGMGLQTYESN